VSRLALLCALFFGVVSGCYKQQSSGGNSLRNVITQEQIESTGYTNVYDVVSRLHGEFLRDRGAISIKTNQHNRAVVFLNSQEYGIPETLRNVPAGGIGEIRYFTGPEAVSKFGSQYGGGVIQLISRSR
jgi:outer membrane cobalamin receptor